MSIISNINPYRHILNRKVIKLAKSIPKDKKVLEIGGGLNTYKQYFDCDFICSDYKKYPHVDKVVDVTSMKFKNNTFDYILCFNVLEHVYKYENAINEMHRCLKKNGQLIISVPFMYPLHDEPTDYFRFSKYALEKLLLGKFKKIKIETIYIFLPLTKFLKKLVYSNIVYATKK